MTSLTSCQKLALISKVGRIVPLEIFSSSVPRHFSALASSGKYKTCLCYVQSVEFNDDSVYVSLFERKPSEREVMFFDLFSLSVFSEASRGFMLNAII
jgi:hypothetical protein